MRKHCVKKDSCSYSVKGKWRSSSRLDDEIFSCRFINRINNALLYNLFIKFCLNGGEVMCICARGLPFLNALMFPVYAWINKISNSIIRSPTSIMQTFVIRIYIITYSIYDNVNIVQAEFHVTTILEKIQLQNKCKINICESFLWTLFKISRHLTDSPSPSEFHLPIPHGNWHV